MVHIILSAFEPYIALIVAILSIVAVIVARRALSRGLTRYAIRVAQISVTIFALLILLRVVGGRLSIPEDMAEILELFGYLGYIIAYALFISSILFEHKNHDRGMVEPQKT